MSKLCKSNEKNRKGIRRLLSVLLALVLIIGLLPIVSFATDDGRYVKTAILPETARNVIYLSDLVYEESINLVNSKGNNVPALRDTCYNNSNPITLGQANITYDKGLGVMPQNPTGDGSYGRSWTTIDISGLKCNNFYATVGITNENGKKYAYGDTMETGGKFGGRGVVFEVYAAYEEDGEFVLLEESGVITKTATYSFYVNVTDVKLLKLAVRCSEDVKSAHVSMNAAWGGACIYVDSYTPNGQINGNGSGVLAATAQNPHSTYDFVNVLPAGGTYLEDVDTAQEGFVACATNGGTTASTLVGDDRWIGGYEANPNKVSGKIDYGVAFSSLVQITPQNSAGYTGYVIYDASKLNGNHFYAAVGNRNQANATAAYDGGVYYGGIVFEVWGSYDANASYDTATYELLAQSEVIYNTNTGEFHVDITGVKWLKLVNRSNTNTRNNCDGVFANACVYTQEKFDISYSNMILANNLSMYIAFKKDSVANWNGHYAKIVYGENEQTVNVNAWNSTTIDGEAYYYVVCSGIVAKEMAQTVSVTIYDASGRQVSNVYTDSVKNYCLRNLLKQNATVQQKQLTVDLLNYGAAAQEFFGYQASDLANNILIDKLLAYGSNETKGYVNNRVVTGTSYYGTDVVLNSNIRMRFAFLDLPTTAKAEITFTDHYGVNQKVTLSYADFVPDGRYSILHLDKLVVADCRQDVTITVTDGDTVIATVVDSVSSYLARKASSEDSALFNALMNLCDSAYSFFHEQAETAQKTEQLTSHPVIITDIGNGRILVTDLDQENPFAEENVIWEWVPTAENGWPITEADLANGLSGVKYRWSEYYQTDVVLFTNSKGDVGMIEYPSGKCLWYDEVDHSPHSIELLPNGDIVVISSGGGVWENGMITFFDMMGATTKGVTTYPLNGGHGVTWDPTNEILWVAGFKNVEAYRLVTDYLGNVTLSQIAGKGASIPGGTGHDLIQDYTDPDILWVTDNKNIYQFSKSQNKILKEYPGSSDVYGITGVKGVCTFDDGVIAWVSVSYDTYFTEGGSRLGSGSVYTYWPSADGTYEEVKYTNERYIFNKVRVLSHDYL